MLREALKKQGLIRRSYLSYLREFPTLRGPSEKAIASLPSLDRLPSLDMVGLDLLSEKRGWPEGREEEFWFKVSS